MASDGIRKDLRAIYWGPLAKRAEVLRYDGKVLPVSGFFSMKTFDRDHDGRHLFKSQRISFTVMREDIEGVRAGDEFIFEETQREIVAIIPNMDGTMVLEMKEEILGKGAGGDEGGEEDSGHGFG